ncbi:MAG: tetratricopeptide repeat protein [bacterium]
MKNLSLLFCVIFFSGYFICQPQERKEIGYQILDLEKNYNFNVKNSIYDSLDAIISRAELLIKPIISNKISKIDAINILNKISWSLKSYGYKKEINKVLFYKAIQDKTLECDSYCFLYLSIAERLKLPLYIIIAPFHSIILWDDGDDKIYWETTIDAVLDINIYKNTLNIDEKSIANGVYLKKLSTQEILGMIYNNIGYTKANNKGGKNDVLNTFNKGIIIYPKSAELFFNRGTFQIDIGNDESGIEDLKKAIELFPNYYDAYKNIGATLSNRGDNKDAILYYNKAVEIKSDFPEAYTERGLERCKLMNFQGGLEDFNKAIELDPSFALAYFYRGGMYYDLKDFQKACKDWEMAYKLGNQMAYQYFLQICK